MNEVLKSTGDEEFDNAIADVLQEMSKLNIENEELKKENARLRLSMQRIIDSLSVAISEANHFVYSALKKP